MAERRALALLSTLVVAAYATAWQATFQFDDAHTVVHNAAVHSWSAWWASLPGIRALTKATFVASHALSPAPWSYIALSVALHAAAACAAFLLLLRWLPSLGLARDRALGAALVAALVFALHPAQTEAVTYVSGRSVVLAGALYLVALLAYERGRAWARVASPVAFALALAARETAWTLPFALLLVELARGRRARDVVRELAPHFGVLAVAGVAVAWSPTYRMLLRESLATRGPLDNAYAQVEAIAYLVSHPLATLRVNFDPGVAVPPVPDIGWWLAALAIVAAIALGCALLRRVPWLGVGILWFFLHVAPTNGVIARYDLANDRQLYLALLGPALVVGVALTYVGAPHVRRVVAVALCAILGLASAVRNLDYASELALWQATVRASPQKSRPWNNLGWAWQQLGDRDRARVAYARAVALDPTNFRARANLDALERR